MRGRPQVQPSRHRSYPEVQAGGFTHVDGTIEFYQRINALLQPDMVVLDYGAGRGRFAVDDEVTYRRDLRSLRGKVQRVIGADIDSAVLSNPNIDEALVLDRDGSIALGDETIDFIVADFVFEHICRPDGMARELDRVLRPGGWICARTPNRWGYIGLAARLVPNRFHVGVLRRLQPNKQERDTFPTAYQINTFAAVTRYFPTSRFNNFSYGMDSEPAYAGGSMALWRLCQLVHRFSPERLKSVLYIFLQKVGPNEESVGLK